MENFENASGQSPFSRENEVSEGKTIAIIAYITIIGLLIAIILNNEKKNTFAAFHIRQGLGIGLSQLVIGMIAIIPFLGWLIFIVGSLLILIMWISGLFSALNGREKPVPILGEKYQEWFKGV